MSRRSQFFRDFLLSAAAAAISVYSGGTLAPAMGAFIARTALILGVTTYSRSQQRKAARNAARSVGNENAVTLRSSDYPEGVAYGRARLPTILDYACHFRGADGVEYTTMVLLLPVRHEIDAIEHVVFDDRDIGSIDPVTGWVLPGSRWHQTRIVSHAKQADGGAPGLVVTLDHAAGLMATPGAVDTVVFKRNLPAGGLAGDELTDYTFAQPVTLTTEQYTVSGNQITIGPDTTDATVTITYRYRDERSYVRVIRNLGVPGQNNFGTLTADSGGEWSATDRCEGIPSLIITLAWDEANTLWAAGLPNVSAIIRAAKVYDPTKDSTNGGTGSHRLNNPATWEWSRNAALCSRDYLRREVGCEADEIDDASFRAAVPVCAAQVQLRGGGTEDAFTCDGFISTSTPVEEAIERLGMTMIGNMVCTGGLWRIVPFAWAPPVLTLPQESLVPGSIKVKSRPGASELVNSVRGQFVDTRPTSANPHGSYAEVDFRPYESQAYIAQDLGRTFYDDIKLPLTVGHERAQRMARHYLFRARSALTITATFSLDAFEVQPGERVRLPWPRYGWNITQDGGLGKVFVVLEYEYTAPGSVTLTLKEDAAAYYSLDFNEAALLDPTPNTSLPPPNYVAPVGNVRARSDSSTYYVPDDGTLVPYVEITFDPPQSPNTLVEVYWKRATESTYRKLEPTRGAALYWIEGVAARETLNIYVQAVNALGARSAISWIPAYVVGADVPSGRAAISANRLRNATLDRNTAHWRTWESGVVGVTSVGLHPLASYRVPGTPSSAYVTIASALSGNGYASGVIGSEMSVSPGDRVVAFAGLIGWGTDAMVQIAFRRSDGTWVETRSGNVVAGVAVESPAKRFNRPEDYDVSALIVEAPAGASYAEIMIVGAGNWSADALKYVGFHQPLIGKLPPGVTSLPPWSPGGQNVVDTPDIRERAVNEVLSKRISQPTVLQPLNAQRLYFTELEAVELPSPFVSPLPAGTALEIRLGVGISARGVIATAIPSHELRVGVLEMWFNAQGVYVGGRNHGAGYLWQREWGAPRAINSLQLDNRNTFTLEPIAYRTDVRQVFGLILSAVTGAGTVEENARPLNDGFVYTAGEGTYLAVTILKDARV